MKELGIFGGDVEDNFKRGVSESRVVGTPSEKSGKFKEEAEDLNPTETTRYRGIVARMNYLGQDRSEIQYAIKEIGKDLAHPTSHSTIKAKRVVRYLKGVHRLVMNFRYQNNPRGIVAWSDSDFAGCEKSRKSTSGGLVMHGNHLIKS